MLGNDSASPIALAHSQAHAALIVTAANDYALQSRVHALRQVCVPMNEKRVRGIFEDALLAREGADRALANSLEIAERCATTTEALRPRILQALAERAPTSP